MRVTICGPNLRDQTKGDFHVHAAGCADLKRSARREPEYENGWTIEAETLKDIVTAVYDPGDFQYDAETEWRDYAEGFYLLPCCAGPIGAGAVLAEGEPCACRYCGQTITRAEDGAWNDEKGACGCGDGEHEPEPA